MERSRSVSLPGEVLPLKFAVIKKPPTADPAKKTKPVEQTFQEPKYLRQLIERGTPIRVKLTDNQEVSGTVEYYDATFIRLTRDDGPNLFIFKHDIKYLYEESQ
jgi:sRNA-binding regulator protein Hfq